MMDEKYGGVITDVSTLPIGTEFFVHNGYWYGKIVEEDNCKFIESYDIHGKLHTKCIINTNHELSISIGHFIEYEHEREYIGCEVCNGNLPVISYELPEYTTKQEYLGDMSLIFIKGTDFKYCPYCGKEL